MLDASPKWTIAGRLKEMRVSDVPGPGTYESGDLNAIYERQPVFTLRPKTELPTDKSPKPSPNSYYPEKVLIWLSLCYYLSLLGFPIISLLVFC